MVVDISVVCHTCLSSDRFLYSVRNLKSTFNDLGVPIKRDFINRICWECKSIVMKIMKFKSQAIEAQDALMQAVKGKDLKCLSKLTYQNNNTYDLEIQYSDPLNNLELESVIKKEDSDSNRSIDEQLSDDVGITDTDSRPHEDNACVQNVTSIKGTKLKIKRISMDSYNSKLSKRNMSRPKRKVFLNSAKIDNDVKDKYSIVVFTEEEMLKNREEKRNQPNFKKIPYKCDSCVLGFTRRETYDLHMEKKHDTSIGKCICDVCQSRFSTNKSLERHRRKHYIVYRCLLCKYECLELWSAASHCRVKHSDDTDGQIHCPQCSTVVQTPKALSEHIYSEHSLRCNECGDKFKGKHTLRMHKIRIHGAKRDFVCDVCGKTFMTKSRLESHVIGHNSTLAKKLAFCSVCNVQYKNLYVYRNHLKNSANHSEKAYECQECQKKFASKVYWRKHCDFYHLHKSQHNCDICNKLFISDWRLKNHRQTNHGLSRSRNHACNVCGKKFFTLSTLRGHQLTHSEERSYMCEDCGDTFKQRPALYTHSRLVHRGGKRRK